MTFTIDLDTLTLVRAPQDSRAAAPPEAKRGDGTPFEVQVVRNGIVTELPTGAVLTFGCKPKGKYDGPAVVLQVGFTKDGTGATTKYSASPSFNTEGLDALFEVDGDDSNDVTDVTLMAEFSWKVDDEPPTSTRTFDFKVNNDVLRGDEDTPAVMPDPAQWMPASLVLEDEPADGFAQTISVGATGGNVTSSGTAVLTLNDPRGAPAVVNVAVLSGDSPAVVRGKCLAACQASSALAAYANVVPGSTTFDLVRNIVENDTAGFNLTVNDSAIAAADIVYAAGTPGDVGTEATRVGQLAIVDEDAVYVCLRVSPVMWRGPILF